MAKKKFVHQLKHIVNKLNVKYFHKALYQVFKATMFSDFFFHFSKNPLICYILKTSCESKMELVCQSVKNFLKIEFVYHKLLTKNVNNILFQLYKFDAII